MENKFLGTIVEWENERWLVDNTDENFKDDDEETSLFLLPERYADADEYDKLWNSGKFDSTGYWVYESYVKELPMVYHVGFNGNDETEVDAMCEEEAIELAKTVAMESGLPFNLDYVEYRGYTEYAE